MDSHGAFATALLERAKAEKIEALIDGIKGGGSAHNARVLTDLLLSEKTPLRDAVLLNAAAGLVIAGKAADLREGAAVAAEAIDEGRAIAVLRKLVSLSHEKIA